MLVSSSDIFKQNARYILPLDTQIRGPDSNLPKMGGFSYGTTVYNLSSDVASKGVSY